MLQLVEGKVVANVNIDIENFYRFPYNNNNNNECIYIAQNTQSSDETQRE